jgi:hypothetical protein
MLSSQGKSFVYLAPPLQRRILLCLWLLKA